MNLILNKNDLLCFVGYGLKCYFCTSEKSWDDCATRHIDLDCPATAGISCVKFYGEGSESKKTFMKGCLPRVHCDDDYCSKMAPEGTTPKCKFDCCVSDLCNGAKAPMISTLLLLACVLAAFRR